VRPGVVVTNAHVVAGQDDTTVQERGTGPALDAIPIAFDSRNDIAVLRVPDLDAPALEFDSSPESGEEGAVLGYPENGPYDVRAARLGSTRTVISEDAYGRGPVNRQMTSFRGVVRSGNSGGPLVSADGGVMTTVFAATTGAGQRGGYGVPNAIVRRIVGSAQGRVGTGPCAS
jgi:S1-C subfamily serine protease